MALPIKGIPTLYGEEARRLREKIEEVEKKFDASPPRDITKDPRYIMALKIIEKASNSPLNNSSA